VFYYIKNFDELIIDAGNTRYSEQRLRVPNNFPTFTTSEQSIIFTYRTLQDIRTTSLRITIRSYAVTDDSNESQIVFIVLIIVIPILSIGVFTVLCYCFWQKLKACCCGEENQSEAPDNIIVHENLITKLLRLSPEIPYSSTKNKYNQSDCCICLNQFTPKSRIRVLECEHIFHGECIVQHIHARNEYELRCPMCNIHLKGEYHVTKS